jgi:hypothetical protein
LLGIGIGCTKPLLLRLYGLVMRQDVRGFGPAAFDVVAATVVYLSLHDVGVAVDSARAVTYIALAALEIIRHFVRDEYYFRAWKKIERGVALVVPYYGKTWAAHGELADRAAVKWTKKTRRWLAHKIRSPAVAKVAIFAVIGVAIACLPDIRRRLLTTAAR